MHKMIIIGSSNNYNELGLVRSFGLCAIKPLGIIICKKNNRSHDWLHLSKYWEKYWFVETAKEAIELLLSISKSLDKKPVVTTPVDYVMQMLDSRYEELSKSVILQSIQGKQNAINDYTNKLKQAELTHNLGFETLKTEMIDLTCAQINEPTIEYPILFKPAAGGEGSKDDITICLDKESKDSAIEKFIEKKYKRILCQQYLENRTEIIAYGALNKAANLCSYTVLKNYRQWPLSYGVGSFGALVTDDQIMQYVDSLYHAVMEFGYDGPIDTDIFLDNNTGNLYLSEYNWRPGGRNYTSIGTKVFSIVLWYYSKIGSIPENMKRINESEGYTINEGTDLNHVIYGNLSFSQWKKDFHMSESHALWIKDDLRPSVRPLMFLFKQYIKENFRKRLNDI